MQKIEFFNPQKSIASNFFIHFFLGFIILSTVLFILAQSGFFHTTPWVLSFLFLVFSVFFSSEYSEIFKKVRTNFSFDIFTLSILALGITLLSSFLWQGFIPFSFGWDSTTHYLLSIKELILFDAARSGIFPYFFELYLAGFGKFFGIAGVNFFLIVLGGFFPIIFYQLGSCFKLSPKVNLSMAITFWTIPAVVFQLTKDIKFDLFFLVLLATSLLSWIHCNRKLSLLFLGFTPLVKLTALAFFPGVYLIIIIQSLQKNYNVNPRNQKNFKKLYSEIFISGFILSLPLLLWTGVNIFDSGKIPQSFGGLKSHIIKSQSEAPKFNFTLQKKFPGEKSNPPQEIIETKSLVTPPVPGGTEERLTSETKTAKSPAISNPTGFKEEAARYKGFNDNFFNSIWAIFTSPKIPIVSKEYVDLSFLWLFFSLLLTFYFLNQITKKIFLKFKFFIPSRSISKDCEGLLFTENSTEKKILPSLQIFILLSSFLFFWIQFGQGIAWYGLPFLGLVYLCIGSCTPQIFPQKIILSFLTLSLVLNIFSALLHSRPESFITSLVWAKTPTQTTQEILENQSYLNEKKVAKILNKNLKKNILKIGTTIKYWVKNANRRMIEDPQLDLFYRLLTQYSDEEIRTLLKQNQVEYIVLDLGTVSIETDIEGSLHRKFETLGKFLERNRTNIIPQLETVSGSRIQLYKIHP